MRTGNIISRDEFNPDLDGQWLEIFPEGNMPDLTITTNIPRDAKRASGRSAMKGQSPLLVRLDWWQAHGPKPAAAVLVVNTNTVTK